MKESVIYQAILEEGRAETLVKTRKDVLLFIGRKRFGPPDARIDEIHLRCHQLWLSDLGEEWLGLPSVEVRAKLHAIDDAPTLEKLVKNLTNQRLKIATWDELFASLEFPSTRRARLR